MLAILRLLSVGLCLASSVSSTQICSYADESDCSCYYGTPNPFDSACQADITVAIDSSVAMLSSTNSNNLIAWLANNLLPAFNLDTDYVQLAFLQYFGNGTFINTDFNTYQTACEQLTGSFVDDGWHGSKASPYEILRTYLLNQKQYGRPGFPQVLVLFTAINDDTLMNAWGMAKQVRDSGTTLLVVGLNQNPTTPYLYYLTDAFKSYPDFFNAPSDANVHPELPLWISQQACTRKAVKVPTSPPKPAAADPSLVNAIGTPCSSDRTHAWLDVQFFFDINIGKAELNDLGFQLAQSLASLTLGDKLPQASCFGLTAVDSNKLSDIYPLKSCVDYGTLYSTLFSLGDTYSKAANTFFLNPVLDAAQANFASRPNKRPQLLIIASKKLSSASINVPTKNKAKALRDKGVYIVTVDYGNNDLEGIATPGQAYSSIENNLDDSLANVFGYANCVCPKGRSQLTVVEPSTNHSVPYADCYEVQHEASPWMFAENACEANGGTLVALNSVEKFSFVEELVKSEKLPAGSDYLIGLQRQRNNTLEWQYYDNQLLQVGHYPPGLSSTGYCGYVSQSIKGAPQIHLAACNRRAPYVCQYRACDSSHFCEL
ncbi:CLEC-61.1 protein [Aphelenchoides avenae]|nr:CLEC-61.1 protein [Aphelenchus avenae]